MSQFYDYTGVVEEVMATQTFASGFTKQEVVVEQPGGERGPIPVPVVFKGDDVSLVSTLAVGAEIKVGFAIDGREWRDPKTDKLRCFCNLTARSVDVIAAAPTAEELKGTVDGAANGDMPF